MILGEHPLFRISRNGQEPIIDVDTVEAIEWSGLHFIRRPAPVLAQQRESAGGDGP